MSLTAYARIKHLEDDENENKILLMEKQFPEEKQNKDIFTKQKVQSIYTTKKWTNF
jgi:hypothetical protein